jgi:putative phosphoribosyl transferase
MLHQTSITLGPRRLPGELCLVSDSRGLVAFVHGSGSSHLSRRNLQVAEALQRHRFGTLLFDLLGPAEAADRAKVFDCELLAQRVLEAIDGLPPAAAGLPLGLFGASTGAAAALVAAAARPDRVQAIVSRGGRPDLAVDALPAVRAPTLLIVGGGDTDVLRLNRWAHALLACEKRIDVVPRATHLFQEAGAMETVTLLATQWFTDHLGVAAAP